MVSAHKTVAILGLIGKADDMHAILDAEGDATLEFLDHWFSHQGGRRGKAQSRTATSGLLYARTRHSVSRAGDPDPHDHFLIANLTEMLDGPGGFKALDTGGLRDLVHAATMVGRMAAAETAVQLGYAIEADRGPSGRLDHWRIAGIHPSVTKLFSKRSDAIDEEMRRKGFASYRARGIAARNTRAPKAHEAPESLILRWRDEVAAIGWPIQDIGQRLRFYQARRHRPLRSLTEVERAEVAAELVGPDGPLAQRKAFTRADVIRHAAPKLYGCAVEELDRVVSAVTVHPEAIPLVGQPGARGRAWAAASALATEAAIETVADRLTARTDRAAVELARVREAMAVKEASLGRPLTRGQRVAAEEVATSGRGLDLIVGVAGSGKTSTLEVARAAFEAGGYRVLGTATSGQAARALHNEAGVESRTIASLVWRLEHQRLQLDDRTVLLIDEAGMTGDPAMLKLLAALEVAGAKAVVIGDHLQLSAVGPGGGLEALVKRHEPAVHLLHENVRQRLPGERKALEGLRLGRVTKAVEWYRDNDRIVAARRRPEAINAAVLAWELDLLEGYDTVLMAWRRADVAALNRLARQRCIEAGMVSGPELESADGKRYAAGDRVVTLAPSGDGRFVTSERATVIKVTRDQLQVRFDDGRPEVLTGDELGDQRLDHAYAVTVHRMQGATVDRAHVVADGGGRELAYVAMSRARDTSHVYVVADDLDEAVDELSREWKIERRQRWVLDVDTPAHKGAYRRPDLQGRTPSAIRIGRLRAEREAVQAVAPEESARLTALDMQLRLEQVGQRPAVRGRGMGIA